MAKQLIERRCLEMLAHVAAGVREAAIVVGVGARGGEGVAVRREVGRDAVMLPCEHIDQRVVHV